MVKLKSKKKKKKIKEPFISKYAPVDYEKLMTVPRTRLIIKLANIKSENSTFEAYVEETCTVSRIKEIINDKHLGSCSQIRLYLDLSDKTKTLEKYLNKQLKEVGLIGESNIYYEFDPILHPLLEM